MQGKKLLVTMAVSAMLFAGCGLKSGETIIKVNNQNITLGQFNAEFDKQAGNGIAKALGIDVKSDKNSFMRQGILLIQMTGCLLFTPASQIRHPRKDTWFMPN